MKKNNLSKKDLAKKLNSELGYSISYSQKLIDDLINCMIEHISISDMHLKNFGTFKLFKYQERLGRNPKTMEKFLINSRKSLRFIPSKKFKMYLNDI